MSHQPRERGVSKYGISRLLRGMLDLINLRFWADYSTRPLHFFGSIGLILFFVGVAIDLYLVALKILYGEELSERPLLLLGVLLIIMGFQIFTTGFMAEIMIRTYYAPQGRKSYVVRETVG